MFTHIFLSFAMGGLLGDVFFHTLPCLKATQTHDHSHVHSHDHSHDHSHEHDHSHDEVTSGHGHDHSN